MNKWKVGFWTCFTLLIGVMLFGLYRIVDQGVTITYLRESCDDTEKDINILIKLLDDTSFTKAQVRKKLTDRDLFEFMVFKQNKVHIHRLTFKLENDKLEKIERQW